MNYETKIKTEQVCGVESVGTCPALKPCPFHTACRTPTPPSEFTEPSSVSLDAIILAAKNLAEKEALEWVLSRDESVEGSRMVVIDRLRIKDRLSIINNPLNKPK